MSSGKRPHRPILWQPTRRGLISGAAALLTSPALAPLARAQRAPDLPAAAGYPVPPHDQSADVLHGVTIPDPFRPLEDQRRPDVQAWVQAHDHRARARLDALENRGAAGLLLERLRRYPAASLPARAGNRYFSMRGVLTGVQLALHVQEGRQGTPRLLVDPNLIARDGTLSIAAFFPDRRGDLVAYSFARGGGDHQDIRVCRVSDGRDLPDVLDWCRHTSIVWLPDGASFYYTRYPADGDTSGADRLSQFVCHHKLGEPQSADRVVFRASGRSAIVLSIGSIAGQDLQITGRIGTSPQRGVWIAPLLSGAPAREIVPLGRFGFAPAGVVGTTHYALTDLGAPRWRLVSFERDNPAPETWRTVIAEGNGILDGVLVFRQQIVVRRLVDASHTVSVHDLDGQKLYDVALPGPTRVELRREQQNDTTVFLGIDSHLKPRRVDRLTLATGAIEPATAQRPAPETDDLTVEQVFVTSRDGTRVPMTLIYRRDLVRDGSARTILYGYGGFGVSQWPGFNPVAITWIRLGGVWATANIRGGGEYGQSWHDNGIRRFKQNSLDDFIAAAEWLQKAGITRPDRLAVTGGSNGGLLVLATMLQRPNLFGAIVSSVPVTDMIRFPRFTFGGYWRSEYGDPDDPEEFRALLAYSPLHNVKEGESYPPLLVLTADNDDRVVPAHAYKFVARITTACPKGDVLLKVQRQAGHGGRNTRAQVIERQIDTIAYLIDKLGGPVLE